MTTPLRILYLEDEPKDAELVQATLEAQGVACHITRVETEPEFSASLHQGSFDLILADYTLPSFDGISALKITREIRPDMPFIFVSGTMGEEVAIEALKMEATDYVLKTRLPRILPSVQRALREAKEKTQRKAAEDALHRNERYLAEAQKLSHTGSFGWHVSSGKIYWSDETFRIFEFKQEIQPTLERIFERVHPEDRQWVRQEIDSATEDRKNFDFEHRLLMPDASVKYVRVVGSPSTKEEPGALEFVGAVTDITERKQAQEALLQARADLSRVNRVMLMGEMAASIAHEVNQPLTGIVAHAGTCLRWLDTQPPDMEEARQSLALIVQDGNRAAEVIGRIRALVKRMPPRRDALDINTAILEVIALAHSELQRNSVELRTHLASDLPLAAADRVQLQQVMLNLIANAIEAMSGVSDKRRELMVRSGTGDANDLFVEVRDSGLGLDPANLDRLFESFYTTKSDGMGMGLSISRSIIEAHGGRLWAIPNQPHGAVFRLTLPVEDDMAS